ncbi:ATP-binding protein [Mucilaginibacter sp.]|uniref:ATP-binding protein n=1 Tax=Mucilaginibacter sp. TaxID=1882438 RepID=UPI0035BC3A7B
MNQGKDRFPGLKSFEKNDADLFFGRDAEIIRLAKMIVHNRVNLVYGSSGVGKSSLLNTIFRKSAMLSEYIPIRIRLSPQHLSNLESDTILPHLRIIKGRLAKKLKPHGIDLLSDLPEEHENTFKLWDYLKHAENKLIEKKTGKIIVLIFDQFEELFTYFKEDTNEFVQQLSEVTHDLLPLRILKDARSMSLTDRHAAKPNYFVQPTVRILFSIRSDKYYLLKDIAAYLPNLYDNQLELKLFTPDSATQAILGPCRLSNNDLIFNSPPIQIAPEVINAIVSSLCDIRGIDLSFLQIICYYIEDAVKNKIPSADHPADPLLLTEPFPFTEEIFKNEIQIDFILDSFYTIQLNKIEDPHKRSLVQHALEDELVSGGQRTILVENQFREAIGNDDDLISFLQNSRLIRTEYTPDGRKTFELSHDKLIASVQKSKTMRLGQETLEKEALEARIRYYEQVKRFEAEEKL